MIVTSYVEGSIEQIHDLIENTEYDYVICADAGYIIAEKLGLHIDVVAGDFDSSDGNVPEHLNTMIVPVEKDDTDLQLALKLACEKNPDEIIILGGIGGRLDHTIGNIQNIVNYSDASRTITMIDPFQSITVQYPGRRTYRKRGDCRFSAFSFTPEVTGVTYEGAYYPLDDHTLTCTYPLGVSNEFLEDEITVTTESGIMLVVITSL